MKVRSFRTLLLLAIFMVSSCDKEDVPPAMNMGEVEDYAMNGPVPDIGSTTDRYLNSPTRSGCEGMEDADPLAREIQRLGSCMTFDPKLYNQPDSGEKISRIIRNSRNKKRAFEEYFAPLAVYVQSKTGYPASALLAQWANETAWGTSKQIRVNNNIGGHSCFKYSRRYKYPTKGKIPSYISPQINVSCTYSRPANEKGYYLTFGSLLEASLAQTYNILHNPATADNYVGTRNVVGNALKNKKKPNPEKCIAGLSGYAAFPASYRNDLIRTLRANNYTKYDEKAICGIGKEENGELEPELGTDPQEIDNYAGVTEVPDVEPPTLIDGMAYDGEALNIIQIKEPEQSNTLPTVRF